jgi:YVTN family beta-propeller protein
MRGQKRGFTRAYVSVYGGTVSVFNTAALARLASIKVSDQPTDIAISKDGNTAYVNSYDPDGGNKLPCAP